MQVTNCEDAELAVRLGAKSIILKGSESGGLVGSETAFVLAQRWVKTARSLEIEIPFLVQGGIGIDTAAAAIACGATGVVLDSQLLLTRESKIEPAIRKWIESADGSEVSTIGLGLDSPCNVFHRRNSETYNLLVDKEKSLEASDRSIEEKQDQWRGAEAKIFSDTPGSDCFLFGQDISLADSLAQNFVTVGGIISGIRSHVRKSLSSAAKLNHLAPDSQLAESHGTKYPLLQGPMTRVSDTADFAEAVSKNGALSFLALAVMRKPEAEKLLEESARRLKGMSWGVGVLGFLPPAIRSEQLEAIRQHKPPFAIIAGGRPDQAKEFEDEGIATYLHVPSPGLLKTFLRQGARRFIFEGRECGGHVGPRSSFVLWQSACDIILEELEKKPIKDLHLVFAGGIHDEISSAMIAAMTAPLAERGVKIGLLMGTAYLFTEEAVDCGAIVPRFQKEAIDCDNTVLLQTGPGHAIRCIKTPYYDVFEDEKNRLLENGASHEDLVRNLEGMNIGRLRVASKGVDRKKTEGSATRELVDVSDEEQFDRGMYMIGQVAALEDDVITMAGLHEKVTSGGTELLQPFANSKVEVTREQAPSEVAIIGMSCYYPDASNLDEYWQNILDRHYAVREIPETHWDWRLFYDEDPKAQDRIVSKWGGFVKDIKFDPLRYGITPKSMEVIEPLQLLTLEAVHFALDDAGYSKRPFNRDRTACIVGIGGGAGPKSVAYGFRTCMRLADYFGEMPILSDEIIERAGDVLPEWTEDSFPGFLANICSGRVANRFNLGGPNYAIDAACASSLASLDVCVRELEVGNVDMAIAMGADAVQTPLSYMAFSKTHALSKKGHSKPFDAEGDGIVLSEGVGVVVLKRLEDAKRDGDKIYAVVSGIGSSSDGKAKGLTAPNAIGQARALQRAYEKANISPEQVRLIEAHGTGTVVGDQTEATALSNVLREAGADTQSCALGSVKSMIGHTKCAAGIAGLIKTALALHHKVLPPTLVDDPNPSAHFDESSLFLNTEVRPWVQDNENPRVAGVSAFGFGGTNFHTVLTEYTEDFEQSEVAAAKRWPTELFVWKGTKCVVEKEIAEFSATLEKSEAEFELAELSAAVNRQANRDQSGKGTATLCIIASSRDDLITKLGSAGENLKSKDEFQDPRGIVFRSKGKEINKVGFLFPGQGSQYPNMLADLAVNFPRVRQSFDLAGTAVGDRISKPLGQYVYPPSSFTEEQTAENTRNLAQTEVAQPALGAASAGLINLLADFGISGDAFAGHSYGEYVAMYASGALTEEQLYEISFLRGQAIRENLEKGSAMLAVNADAETVESIVTDESDVYISNINSPGQTVLSVVEQILPKLEEKFAQLEVSTKRIPVACGFHSPFVEKAATRLGEELEKFSFGDGSDPVYSNSTASKYPDEVKARKSLLQKHLTNPVNFVGMIGAMREDGVDLFIEVGPGSVLSNLCKENTTGQDCDVLAVDRKGRHGVTGLQSLLGKLSALGLEVDLDLLARVRKIESTSVKEILTPAPDKEKPNTWIVNGVRSKLATQPEPLLLGQPHPDLVKAKRVEEVIHSKSSSEPSPKKKPPAGANGNGNGQKPPETAAKISTTPPKTKPMGYQDLNRAEQSNGNVQPAGSDKVMMGFQNLMSQFLETQRAVMTSYLGGTVLPSQSVHQPPHSQIDLQPSGNGSTSISEVKRIPRDPTSAPVSGKNGDRLAKANGDGGHPTSTSTPDVVLQNTNGSSRIDSTEKTQEPSRSARGDSDDDISIDEIKSHLLEIVGERTGYPEDMLDLDLDLEADLGIDSIKRVEILGELAEFIMPDATSMEDDGGLDLEKLSGLRTLQQILDYLEEFLDSREVAVAVGDTKKKTESVTGEEGFSIQRGLVGLKQLPVPSGASPVIPNGVVLITDDGNDVASACADRLADFGQDVVVVRHQESEKYTAKTYSANLTSSESVASLIEDIRKNLGPIGGVIHLLPFAEISETYTNAERAELEVKSIYLITKTLEEEIVEIASQGNALVISATVLGGQLGFGKNNLDSLARAGGGAISGYLKCLGMEWPDVLVRTIDFHPSTEPDQVVETIERELSDPAGPFEVGYLDGERVTWEPDSAEFENSASPSIELDSDSVILITGGARGITAAIAEELADRFQPRLILLGRSPLPPKEEDSATCDFEQPADLKKAIMEMISAEGIKPTPALVESRYKKIITEREVRANLEMMEAAGAKVEYHSVDVRDRDQLSEVCDDLYQRFGKIDGVIHGAGIIDDKLIKDKTPDSFDRVFSTKVESSFAFADILRPKSLKFVSLFASIASRYGNRGQSDYAAANEVLCKLATELDRRWDARVFAVAWGPWTGIGMVSDLEKHLTARGIALIQPEVGCRMFVDEILYGKKGESEVIIAGGAENMITPSTNQALELSPVGSD